MAREKPETFCEARVCGTVLGMRQPASKSEVYTRSGVGVVFNLFFIVAILRAAFRSQGLHRCFSQPLIRQSSQQFLQPQSPQMV